MLGLLGKKLGMTTIYKEDEAIPATILKAGPCEVIMVKNEERDGYRALQLGFEETKKDLPRPLKKHFEKASGSYYKVLQEFRIPIDQDVDYEPGDIIDVDFFQERERVDCQGTSKGKGFSGVVRKYNFAGGSASHGTDATRTGGSIGMSADPGRVLKNQRMAGQEGARVVTEQNLEIVDIDEEDSLISVRGAVPGSKNGYIKITKRK